MHNFRKKVGKRLRQVRRMKDISQEALAFNTGNNSQAYISKIETGKLNFSVDTLGKILKILEINPKEFFSEIK